MFFALYIFLFFFASSFSMENFSLSEEVRDLYIKNAQNIQRAAFSSSYVNPTSFNDVALCNFYFKLFYFDVFELDTVNIFDLSMQISWCKNAVPIIKILNNLFSNTVEIKANNSYFKKLFNYIYLKVFSKLDFGNIQQAKLNFEKARYEFFYNLTEKFKNNGEGAEEKIVLKKREVDEENVREINDFLKFFSSYAKLQESSDENAYYREQELIEEYKQFASIENVKFSIDMPDQINTLFKENCGNNPFLFKHLIVALFENKTVEELVLSVQSLDEQELIEEDKKHLDFEYYKNIKYKKTNFMQAINVNEYLRNIFSLDEKKKLFLKSEVTKILKTGFINIVNSCCDALLIDSESEITKKFLLSNLCNNFFDQQIRSFPLFMLGQTFTKEYSEYGKKYLPVHEALKKFLELYMQYYEFYECIDQQEKYQKNSNHLINDLSKIGFSDALHGQIKKFYEEQFNVFLEDDIQKLSEENGLDDLWKKSVALFNGNSLQFKSIEREESDFGGEEIVLEVKKESIHNKSDPLNQGNEAEVHEEEKTLKEKKQEDTNSSNFYVFCDCSMIKPAMGGAAALSSGSLMVPFFLRKVGLSSYKEITPFNRKKFFLVALSGGALGYGYSFYKKNNTKIRSTCSNLYKKLTNKKKDDWKEDQQS